VGVIPWEEGEDWQYPEPPVTPVGNRDPWRLGVPQEWESWHKCSAFTAQLTTESILTELFPPGTWEGLGL